MIPFVHLKRTDINGNILGDFAVRVENIAKIEHMMDNVVWLAIDGACVYVSGTVESITNQINGLIYHYQQQRQTT